MKTSSDIAKQTQYIILVILSLLAIILWQNGLNKAETEAAKLSSKTNIKKPKEVKPLDLDKLHGSHLRKFEKLYCPKLDPIIKNVVEFLDQECECSEGVLADPNSIKAHKVKNEDLREKLLAKRTDKDTIGETDDMLKKDSKDSEEITKPSCMKLLAMKIIFKQKKEDVKNAVKSMNTVKVVTDRKEVELENMKNENVMLRGKLEALNGMTC